MQSNELFIYQSIIQDMSEGVLTIGLDGMITSVNEACRRILEAEDSLVGSSFALSFFEHEENDGFNQAVLDAIYDRSSSHNNIVDFYTGRAMKKLFLTTSYLHMEGKRQGVIVVINDVSELYELKDAIKAMEQIQALNEKLQVRNKLISETFGRYMSDEIVNNLLDKPGGLELGGVKQQVTILMSDLRGFTAMSERMPPVDLMTMLNNYLGEMTEIILRYKGTIIEFIGDAIFAIFGAPVACDTPERNAVACAVEMQNRMGAVNRFNEERGYPQIEMGIGVNTGPVILGNIGSEKRAKYGVVGQHVNLCGRIEGYTVGGQVLVSDSAKAGIPDLETRSRTEILPKGVQEPVTIYEVAAVGDLFLEAETDELVALAAPEEIQIHVLDGKFAGKAAVPARILALSPKQAVLDVTMDKYTNIKFLREGREVFAKFIDEYRIRMTV